MSFGKLRQQVSEYFDKKIYDWILRQNFLLNNNFIMKIPSIYEKITFLA